MVLEGHPLYLGVQWRPGPSLAFSARPGLGRGSREPTLGGQADAKGGRHVDSVEFLRLAPFKEGKACQGEQGGVEEDAGHGARSPEVLA